MRLSLIFIHGGAWLGGSAKNAGYPAELFVNAVWFADAQHGWASIEVDTDSPDNGVYRTDDGGRTWSLVHIP